MSKVRRYQAIFRAANFLGLFPVSGLFASSKKIKDGELGQRENVQAIEFRPASWRLLATLIFIIAVLILEGMGIIHMLVSTDGSYTESHVDFVTYRHGTIASDLAPVLHYGATVVAVMLLINSARRFPRTAALWEDAEEDAENTKGNTVNNAMVTDDQENNSKCPSAGSVLIVLSIVFSAILQTIVGTLTTVVIDSALSNSSFNGDDEFDAVHDWLRKYMLGSHGFVSALADGETFWTGLAIFVVSNYTVIVWVVVDLILILSSRNISRSAKILNKQIKMMITQNSSKEQPNLSTVPYIRKRHWNICRLVYHLDASMSGIYLCFFVTNLFFMWNHLQSLASPPVDLYIYTAYQIWSLLRQALRFVLVTSYAVSVSRQLKKPMRNVMGLSNAQYDKESRRLQEQSSLTYNGFNAGPFIRLDEKTISFGSILLLGAFWFMFQFHKQQMGFMDNTAIIMMKHDHQSDNPLVSGDGANVGDNVRPAFEFQVIDKPTVGFFETSNMPDMNSIKVSNHLSRPKHLNIFQW